MKRALVVWGGWAGHEPDKIAALVEKELSAAGFAVEVTDTLDAFRDEDKLKSLDLIVPVWTMGKIEKEQLRSVSRAVAGGVGLGGCHGGMCDAFREAVEWQFMTGGNWVAHPGNAGVTHEVNVVRGEASPVTERVEDFTLTSEQYYMHVDPAVRVLATMKFGDVTMPVTWTKHWGRGRVFYTSIGHTAGVFDIEPARRMFVQGLLWAADGKAHAASVRVPAYHAELERVN